MRQPSTSPSPAAPKRTLWRHAAFLKLWSAQTISQFGTQVTLLALPLAAILVLDANAFQVGLLGTFEFLPFILVGLPAGVWVDRMRRRPILIAGDLGRAAALGSIPIAHAFDVLTMGQLYLVAFVTGILTVFFDVAYQSYLPSLVDRDQLVDGNGKLEVSRSAAQIGGPGLAGVLIERITAPLAILADSISYLGSAAFLVLIRRHESPVRVPEGSARPTMRREIGEGLRFVLGHRLLRWIAATTATSNLFSAIGQAVLLLYGVRRLGLSAGLIGAIFVVANVGALLAAFTAGRVARWFGLGPTIVGAIFVGSLGGLLLPAASEAIAVPVWTVAFVLLGLGTVLYNVNQVSLRQAICPDRMQGRMNATMRFMVWGTLPIGSFLGGILGVSIGLRPTLWVAGVGGLTGVLPVLLSGVRKLERIPEPEPVEPEEPGEVVPGLAASDEGVIEAGRVPHQGMVEDSVPAAGGSRGAKPSDVGP
jgi:MFS family permease